MKNVVIVIPIYRQYLTKTERMSLVQCINILNKYDIVLVCPKTLNLEEYKNINKSFLIQRFPDSYFKNKNTYSKLCLSESFYKSFKQYKYMLIYQLDCWVFKDDLQKWCNKDFDYIGAPWPSDHLMAQGLNNISLVGNGGLSLRKISTMIELCKTDIKTKNVKIRYTFKYIYNLHKKRHLISNILNFPLLLSYYIFKARKGFTKNEDVIIAKYAKQYIPAFNIPCSDVAAHFSIEMTPEYFYMKNHGHLPFGCHGWQLSEHFMFWKEFIEYGTDYSKSITNPILTDTKVKFTRHNMSYKENNNQIIVCHKNKSYVLTNHEIIRKLNVSFIGKNNILKIYLPVNLSGSQIIFRGNNNNFIFNSYTRGPWYIELHGTGCSGIIGRGTSCCGTNIYLIDSSIEIGKDCMFSNNISIWSDGHAVLDKNSMSVINLPKGTIKIGNHVWVGEKTIFTKRVSIADFCIIGAGSVVTKPFNKTNCIIAGNPAMIVKEDITWREQSPYSYETTKELL